MTDRFDRPWGWYENLKENEEYKVKRLYIYPNQKISLQYHNQRDDVR
jgi:mannose-6-phosphate isomerase-like protein (cupin superfamily)